ncbi:MAG: hypothetical protein IJX55_05505 [Clostridia bacterium]|nr:hypothetical protein [Clostridia bacterium]
MNAQIFYDERIEKEKGKVCRNCILIAVIGTLCFGALQLVNILLTIEAPQFHHYMNVFLPGFIFIAGTVSLAIGLYLEKFGRDERTQAEAYAFYGKAARRLLTSIAVVWAILLPYTMVNPMPSYNFYNIPFDYAIWILFYPICTYLVYSFKKNEIYFNYSLLESEHYYKGVFKNIGKFSLWALGLFAESIFSYILFHTFENMQYPWNDGGAHMRQIVYSILAIFFIIAIAYVVLSILYLSLSLLEKESYDNETRLISKATVVSFIVAACLTTVVFFITLEAGRIIDALANSDLPLDFPLSSVVAAANYVINYIDAAIYLFAVLCITYFYYEYRRARKNRLLTGALCTILIIKSADVVISPIYRIVMVLVNTVIATNWENMHDIYIEQTMGEIFVYYTHLIGFAEVVAVMLIIAALIKDGTAHKVCIALICAIALALCVMLFLTTQLSGTTLSQAMALFNSFIYLCLAVLVAIIGRKNIHSIDK